MANRRLAPNDVQPEHFAFTAENENWVVGQIAKYPEGREASAVIPLLWRAQEQAGGWLPRKAIEAVAARLGMPFIRVLEVATFYTMFALEPVGRYWIQVCGTVPCDSCGARELKDMLGARLGPAGHVSADGNFSWLEVECLGACCNAPMAQINQDYYEDLTPESLGKLMDDLAAGRPVKRGSQVGRVSSEPEGAVNTLQDATLYDGSRVGAWRKRFEEATVQPAGEGKEGAPKETKAETGAPAASGSKGSEANARDEAASTDKRVATDPKAAQPHVGRPNQGGQTDALAQRASAGQPPTNPETRERQSSPDSPNAAPYKSGPEEQPAPQSAKSYTATPGNPDAGRPVAGALGTTPEAGTPTSAEPPRRSGAEAVPVGADAVTGLPPGPTDPRLVVPEDVEAFARAEAAEVASRLAALPKDAAPEARGDAAGTRPATLTGAREGGPDDLTRIRGVGESEQRRLHDLGIWHLDQIAAWERPQIRWVSAYLALPGRIDRENWVGQAADIVKQRPAG